MNVNIFFIHRKIYLSRKNILAISTTNDVQMEDVNRSLNEEVSMESNQQSSILSRSQNDDDIVEIDGIIRFRYVLRPMLRITSTFCVVY